MADAKVTRELVERAIAGERHAVREFIDILEPIFRVRIGRVLLFSGYASAADIDDVCAETLFALLAHNGERARSWDPDRGSFENFSGLIAKQRAIEELRKRKEELLQGDPRDLLGLELVSNHTPELIFESKEMLCKIFEILKAELSDLGRKLFELLFVEEREVAEVCALMKMEKDAVYAWRSRLGRRIEEIAATMRGAE